MIASPYVSTLAAEFLSFQGTDGRIFQETEGEEHAWGRCTTGMFSIKTTRFTYTVFTGEILKKGFDDYSYQELLSEFIQ